MRVCVWSDSHEQNKEIEKYCDISYRLSNSREFSKSGRMSFTEVSHDLTSKNLKGKGEKEKLGVEM